jgi:D-beta-D-heptose 7-phosphate kinase/D-beta-D-heptose 1-phosphate adenosyltransferase
MKSRVKDVGLYRPAHHWVFGAGASLDSPAPRPEPPTSAALLAVTGPSKLVDLVAECRAWRTEGRRIVLTNGCFDLLHPGHLALLEAARAEGDRLVVAINSDASVAAIKGPLRPVTHELERTELLLALEAVDRVVVYDEPTPIAVIRALRPDVLVKGADWPLDQIVGREDVEGAGGRVVRVEILPGRSTSGILERIRKG